MGPLKQSLIENISLQRCNCNIRELKRTTTKFTTTTSVDRESTGTRTSVSAGNRELKMQSIGRTTTALNVNKLYKNCSFATKFFRNGVF